MKKEIYIELLNGESKEIYLSNDDVKEWLDAVCEAVNAFNDTLYDLCWGVLDEDRGEYEHNINPIPYTWHTDTLPVQIHHGIELLADAASAKLKKTDRGDSEYPFEYGFEYRGVYLFQLSNDDVPEWEAYKQLTESEGTQHE